MNKLLTAIAITAFTMQTFAATTSKKATPTQKTTTTSQKRTTATETTTVAPAMATTPATTSNAAATTTTAILFAPGHNELFLTATSGTINTGNNATDIKLSGMYGFLMTNHIELGLQFGLGSTSYKGSSVSSSEIFAVGIYNLGMSDIANDGFAFAAAGFGPANTSMGKSDSKFAIKAGGGKRFSLWSKVQLVPQAWVEKLGDLDPTINLMPVNFSVLF